MLLAFLLQEGHKSRCRVLAEARRYNGVSNCFSNHWFGCQEKENRFQIYFYLLTHATEKIKHFKNIFFVKSTLWKHFSNIWLSHFSPQTFGKLLKTALLMLILLLLEKSFFRRLKRKKIHPPSESMVLIVLCINSQVLKIFFYCVGW